MDQPKAIFKTVTVKQVTQPPKRPEKKRRTTSWLGRGCQLLLIVGATAWFAPNIVAVTSLRNRIPQWLLPKFSGVIESDEATLSWLSPIVLKNIRISHHGGPPILEVQQLSSSETLWNLVSRRATLGTFKISQPVVRIAMRNDGSNVEDLISEVFGSHSGPNGPIPDVIVEIENGKLELEHKPSNRQTKWEQLALRFVFAQGGLDECNLILGNPATADQVAANADGPASEWLLFRYGSPPHDGSATEAKHSMQFMLRSSHLNLERLMPVLPRAFPIAELSGELNADASLVLSTTPDGRDWDWNGTVELKKLFVAGIDAIKRDRLALERVDLTGRAVSTQGRLAMQDLKFATDVGEVTATGNMPLTGNGGKSISEFVQSWLSDEDYHLNAHVNLKKLAALLPETLRIREGIEITAGDLQVEVVGADVNGVRRWSGLAGIVGLSASNQGTPISWDQPLATKVNAHRDQASIVVDRIECKSDFLQVAGSGTLNEAEWSASGDLSKLVENVDRFIDLGIERLSGQMAASGVIRRIDVDHVGIDAKVKLTNFAYVVSSAKEVTSSINNWKLAGSVDMTSDVVADAESVDMNHISVAIQNLEADGPDWFIQEPKLQWESTAHWDHIGRKLTSPKTTMVSNSLSLQINDLACTLTDQGSMNVSATTSYQADLKQISHWKNQVVEQPSRYLIGNLTGTSTLSHSAGISSAKFDAQVEKFMVVGPSSPANGPSTWVSLFQEPLLKLSAQGGYVTANDRLTIEAANVTISGLSVAAKGTLDSCTARQQLDLSGDLAYDWGVIVARFGDSLRKNVQFQGKDQRPFSVHGSLASLSLQSGSPSGDLSGQAGLNWDSGKVYGMVAGPGAATTQFDHGVGQFAPIDVSINDGRLHLTPAIHLQQTPLTVVLPAEKVLDGIRLSPEICRDWLKYVLPTLADATQVDGTFSFEMQHASLPLMSPLTGRLDGVIEIHRAQVMPGPLGLQIIDSIEKVQSVITRSAPSDPNPQRVLVELPEQQVPTRLESGRVYHEGLTLLIKNVSVRTKGSVGTDQTLNLTAEIGVRDEWLANNAALSSLQGKSIQVQIVGTLSRPQLDPQSIARLVEQIGGSAIEGLIQDKLGNKLNNVINKGLDKLLKPKE